MSDDESTDSEESSPPTNNEDSTEEEANEESQESGTFVFPSSGIREVFSAYQAAGDTVATLYQLDQIAKETGAREAIVGSTFPAIASYVGTQQTITNSLSPALASYVGAQRAVASSVLPALVVDGESPFSGLSAIHHFSNDISGIQSTLSAVAKVAAVSQPPTPLLKDIAAIQGIAASATPFNQLESADYIADFNIDQAKTTETPEVTEEIDDEESGEDEVEYLNWQARYAEAHIDGPYPATGRSPVEVDPQMPVLVAYQIVSDGETFRWLSSMGRGYRITIVSGIIYTAAVACGFQYPGAIVLFGTAIEEAVFASDDSNDG